MNKDEMNDDAQFEAFLNGEGDLARRLQAMPQAEPGAELDAAIRARIRASMARESSGAANDPGEDGPVLATGSVTRWRWPAGLAATVLAGLFASQAYQAGDNGTHIGEPAVEHAAAMPQTAVPLPPADKAPEQIAQAAAPAPEIAAPVPRAMAPVMARARPKARAPVVVVASPPAPAPVPAAPQTAAAPPAEYKLSSQPMADAARSSANLAWAEQRVEVFGSRIRLQDETLAAAAWVDKVEALLKEGNEEEAKREWVKLRKQYPAYKAPDALAAKMKALLE